jgi:hypothetical protein
MRDVKKAMAWTVVGLGGVGAVVALLFGPKGEREICVPERPMARGEVRAGYELVDVGRHEVWATRDFTEEEFRSLSLPLLWPLWFKNGPRIPDADHSRFLRSPGCPPGAFTYLRAFGKRFVKVVDLHRLRTEPEGSKNVRRVELEKHHVLTYEAGRAVHILQDAAGERFIRVSRAYPQTETPPTLPERWTVASRVLSEELRVELTGLVTVLRLDNEDSYQGPIR